MEEKLKIEKTTTVMPSVCVCVHVCVETLCVCLQSPCRVYECAKKSQKGSECLKRKKNECK